MIFIFLASLIVFQFPTFYKYLDKRHENNYNYFDFSFNGFFENIGIPIFSFNCLSNFYGIHKILKNSN